MNTITSGKRHLVIWPADTVAATVKRNYCIKAAGSPITVAATPNLRTGIVID
jgi:hypothetical protein